VEPKPPGSKPKLPGPPGPPDADTLSRRRALVVDTPAKGGSVLFGYLSRPTAPRMPAVRQPPSGTLVLEQSSNANEQEILEALAFHAKPSWSDCQGPPTQRPESLPVSSPSPIPEASAELSGTLTRIDGPSAGRVVSLRSGQLTIGRSPQADLHLAEDGVSRKHARICWADGAYVLEDLGSQNGTFLWGKPISAVQLRQGDLIRVGPVATLRFCWMDEHQKRLLEELYESSVRDPLTGAFNRRHFGERLEAELAYAKRHAAELSLLLLDIDYFKKINDQYGHLEGDRVLRALTHACSLSLRTEDVLARYGGEEFAVLLRGVPLDGAVRAAERLRRSISEQVFVGTPPVSLGVSVSVGCASLACLEERTSNALIHLADQRLYEAKQAGRGRVVAEGLLIRE
jgi:two-component system cell cycle response regulator